MAELLIVVVAAVVLLLYGADRARKLRARARQMSAMNDRLDAAVAKVDQEQQKKRARVRASAELTSVLPAIKRPPLTLPGMPGTGSVAEEEAAPAAAGSGADGLAAEEDPATQEGSPAGLPAVAEDSRTANGTEAAKERQTADSGAGEAQKDREPGPDAPAAGRDAEDDLVPAAAAETPAKRVGLAESTLSMPASRTADGPPVLKIRVTSEGTLIMPMVPDHGPVPAGRGPATSGRNARR
jgi:Sec-independent protein translocase protein TatA